MVTGMWGRLDLHCGHHEEPIRMELLLKGALGYYVCPDPNCECQITIREFEKMMDYFSELIYTSEINGEQIYLTNYIWKNKKNEYKVLDHSDKIKIQIINKEILKKEGAI